MEMNQDPIEKALEERVRELEKEIQSVRHDIRWFWIRNLFIRSILIFIASVLFTIMFNLLFRK